MADTKPITLLWDRFENEAKTSLRKLKQHCMRIQMYDRSRNHISATREREEAKRLADQLLSGLAQIMLLRKKLNDEGRRALDSHIEQLHIQATIDAVNILLSSKPLSPGASPHSPLDTHMGRGEGNPFDECFADDTAGRTSVYEEQLVTQMSYDPRVTEMRMHVEQVKEDAEATEQIGKLAAIQHNHQATFKEIEDLNQIMVDLASLVHSQNEMVESIEEHVERSTEAVRNGQRQLRKAVASNNAKYPLVAAAVGGVVAGGPVGVAASSAIAGIAAAIGGALMGLYGGRALKKQVQKEATETGN